MSNFRSELKGSQVSVGTFFKSNSPAVAEVLSATELDFLLVDRQHASPNLETIESLARASELNNTPILVRIPEKQIGILNNVLDMGAAGVMIPQVNDPSDVMRFIDEIKYSRERSFASSTRSGKYGQINSDEYIEWVNNEIVVLPQIETEIGVENVEQIAAMSDVDGVMIGPADLAISMGLDLGSAEVGSLIDSLIKQISMNECPVGMYGSDLDGLNQYKDDASFMLLNSDIGAMADWFTANLI